jgi:hypothetical protein
MDLLASSCCPVSAVAVGKAIEIWAAQRRFGGVNNSQFAALQIFTTCAFGVLAEFGHSAATVTLSWVLLVRGCKGFWLRMRGGGEKVLMVVVMIGSRG